MESSDTLPKDPYLEAALEKTIAWLDEERDAMLSWAHEHAAALAEGENPVYRHPKTDEEMPPPGPPEEVELAFDCAKQSLGHLKHILPKVADWQTQRNIMTLVMANGLRSVLFKGVPFEAYELVMSSIGVMEEFHETLSEAAPHQVPARTSARLGDSRKPGETLFDIPLRYAERGMTSYDALCTMTVALQKEQGVPEGECLNSPYALALDRYLERHNLTDETVDLDEIQDELAEISEALMVELFEPFYNEMPYLLCPEMAWFVVQAAKEISEDIGDDGQMTFWDPPPAPELPSEMGEVANDNEPKHRRFVDMVYSPAMQRRVQTLLTPIFLQHADMGESTHILTAAMDRCEERIREYEQSEGKTR